ncbi:hypothetical protein DFJ63DRAFT_205800 [Scheffersomyces coipomensis]|uniref:uncharacterized protein n=1 Tax=Scheffersomyces coipomensis TaxID=1788519 RepID=UPI00315C6BE7
MSIQGISPLSIPTKSLLKKPIGSIPLAIILKLNELLKKSVLSRKFYQEINDKVLSKSSTVDANLYFICYFTLLISAVLNNQYKIKHWLKLQRFNLLNVIKRVLLNYLNIDLSSSTNSPNKFLINLFNAPKPTFDEKEASKPSPIGKHFKAVSSYLSDIRIFNRLTESIKYAPWIIDEFTAMTDPTNITPKSNRIINFLQSINCLVLELLENAGWITDHNWVGTNDNDWWSFETYIWCSRIWGLYLVIEIVELFRRTPISEWSNTNWKIAVFKQVIQVPLVLHWSLREGCLSPFWVGVCGSGASWWGFRDIWSSIDLS